MLPCTYSPSPHSQFLGGLHPSPCYLHPSCTFSLTPQGAPLCSGSSTLTRDRAQSISWTTVHGGVAEAMAALYGPCSAWSFLKTQEGGIVLHVLTPQQENFLPHYNTLDKLCFSSLKLQ